MWIVDGLLNAARMAWEVWWALILGFALSAVVQAWVPRAPLERTLGGRGLREVSFATALGAASSSCSYAAIAGLGDEGRARRRRARTRSRAAASARPSRRV
jgi:uncharacterized membrane protein YraQ (UPF0718 family)